MSYYRERGRAFLIKGLVLTMTLGTWFLLAPSTHSRAALKSVAVGTTTLTPTPVFRNGGNTVVVIGSDVGLNLASAFEVRATCQATSPLRAMGSITKRETALLDRIGIPTGKLTLSLPLTPTVPLGPACGLIKHPAAPPDTFPIMIFNRGTVTGITVTRPGNATPLSTVTVMEPVDVTFTGSFMGTTTASRNIIALPYLPGTVQTRTQTTFRMRAQFNRCGSPLLFPGFIYDGAAPSSVIISDTSKRYQGSARLSLRVVAGDSGCPTTTPPSSTRPLTMQTAPTAPFVDVAPRANMLNLFRRLSTTAAFTLNGASYYRVDSERWCRGMSGNQSTIITVPNPVWGISNVGTADINAAFASQLRRGTQVLATQNVTTLNPGATVNFTYQRPNSRVRVRTFTDRSGCFVSPTADAYFEDPRFTVVVNTNGGVQEASVNQANNTRSY